MDELNRMSRRRTVLLPLALAVALLPALAGSASAASPVSLGTADSFALLAGSTITNTGPTTITGDIGLCCTGTATTGFGSLTQPGGTQYAGTGTVAATAQDDLDIAYANAAGQAITATLPVDLSLAGTPASPLLPGVYESTAHGSLRITTGLTLDFKGDPNAVFIFQGTDLTTAAAAAGSVNIVNGGAAPSACNIFWQLSSDATGVSLGASSAFKGTTMALGASVLGNSATVRGRILTRRSKAVTLDTNTITRSGCVTPTGGGGDTGTTTTPGSGGSGGGSATAGPAGGGATTSVPTSGGGTAGGGTGSGATGGGTAGGGAGSGESNGGSAGGGAQTGGGTSGGAKIGGAKIGGAKIGGAKIGGDTAAGDNGGGETGSGTAAGDTGAAGRGESSGRSEEGSTSLTGPNLPFTGLEIGILALLGLVLFLSGVVLRRRVLRQRLS